MKKLQGLAIYRRPALLKLLLIMNFLLVIIFFTAFQALAINGVSQKRINLDLKNESIVTVLKYIESNYRYRFFYSDSVALNRQKVDVLAQRATIDQIMDQLLKATPFSYKKMNQGLVVIVSHENENLSIPVKGKVFNDKGEPLPGVSIVEKGTANGTVTSPDGSFSIDVKDENSMLVISSVGYVTLEISVKSDDYSNIVLTAKENNLDDVVVIGFGQRKQRDLTGSISTVNADRISKSGAVSPQFALQGNATGVRVINTSGNPSEAPQIFIRGIGTWNGDAQPLYVVDGQILEPPRAGNEDLIGGGGLRTPPNLFNLINANDIESISVLKDASAAAVYGSRAANGVVLITTKRGKRGAPKLEFNTRMGIQNSPKYKMLNTTQFVEIAEEMYENSTNSDVDIFTQLYGRAEANDALRLVNRSPQFDKESPYYISDRTTYDWQNEMLRRNALNQTYDVRISGANERVDYYVSAGMLDHEGVIYGNNLKRMNGAINLNIKVTDWAKVGVNYKYTWQETKNNRADLPDIADAAPWQPIYDPSNKWGYATVLDPYRFGSAWQAVKRYGQGSNTNYKALTDLEYSGFNINRSLGQFYLELKPLNGLTLRGSLNMDYSRQDRLSLDAWSRTEVFKPAGQDPRTRNANAPNSLGQYIKRSTNVFNYQSDFTATYDRIFADKHHITLLAGAQDQRHEMETSDINGGNLITLNGNPRRNGWSGALGTTSSSYGWGYRYWFGMVGRASYDYANKYYIDASYRRDASNGFDKAYRWGNFYSVSGAWRISSEKFFNLPFVDDLKIRGGWGQAGNDQAAVGQYPYLSLVYGGLSSYRWGSGNGDPLGNMSLGALINGFPSPELSWEVATTSYVGADAYLFNNKLNLTFEWYHRLTSGILQTVNLPLSVGVGNPLSNIGEMVNKGVDLSAGYQDRIGDFTYNISGNISFVKNKVTKLYNGQPLSIAGGRFERDDAIRVEEGRSVGVIWGYKVGGIFLTQEQVAEYFARYPDNNIANIAHVGPGDMYFLDVQGDPTDSEPFYSRTPDGKINASDQTEIGNTIPGHTYGLTLGLGWKGFDLSAGFYGEGNVQKYNSARHRFENMSGAGSNFFASTLNRWTPTNTQTDMPRAIVGDPAGNNRMSDRWVESAAFFRLNNWQLGYTLPASALALVNNRVSHFRFYIGGENNLYAFRWRGIDPVNDAFPLPRTFNAGLNVTF